MTGNANIVNIADIFERQYATYSAARLQQQIDWKPDVVVLQFGENIPPQTFDAVVFKKSLKQLVADFQNSGNPNIFMTGYILGSNAVVDDIKRQVCAEDKTHRVFVDLSRVWPDPATHGEFGHPNDKGMAMVADLLFRDGGPFDFRAVALSPPWPACYTCASATAFSISRQEPPCPTLPNCPRTTSRFSASARSNRRSRTSRISSSAIWPRRWGCSGCRRRCSFARARASTTT